jgi:glycine cleavage system aminomethyltransferase T
VLRGHVPDAVLELGYYRFTTATLFGVPATISRTGYTGEDGFELYFDVKDGDSVWNGLIAAGQPHGLELIGLGARDTLRLEDGLRALSATTSTTRRRHSRPGSAGR